MASLIDLIKSSFGQKQNTASLAKERLQIIIAREHSSSHKNFLPQLEKELIAVISKYVTINEKDIKVSLNKQGTLEVLDVNIVIDGDTPFKLQ
jgi:cell division topological specificity factor